jgi:hypothetical protein
MALALTARPSFRMSKIAGALREIQLNGRFSKNRACLDRGSSIKWVKEE